MSQPRKIHQDFGEQKRITRDVGFLRERDRLQVSFRQKADRQKIDIEKKGSRRWGLNPRPTDYESVALPLSYSGRKGGT